jgi:2-ketoarginine methyltransferase
MPLAATASTPEQSAPSRPLDGHADAKVDPGFEQRLIEGIRPIAEHFLAGALHHLFDTGIFAALAGQDSPVPLEQLSGGLGLDIERLRGFLFFLSNENVVVFDGERVSLTMKGHGYGEFRGWYTMFVGGYGSTLQQIGAGLQHGAPYCSRDGRNVGLGSCEISQYDGIPVVRSLLDRAGVRPRELLDLGCGNGLYLVRMCQELPGMSAWGSEPDPGGHADAVDLIQQTGLADRIQLRNASATEFLRDPPADCEPDLVVFGFVLQELLEQEGEPAVISLLQGTVQRFPKINIVVVEVQNAVADPAVMKDGVARNFWNPYYLIHAFTEQRLESRPFWEDLFEAAGLRIEQLITTDPAVDSSGVEVGYLLRGATS